MLKFKAIKPAPVKNQEASDYLRQVFKDEIGKSMLEQFAETTQHWTGERPEWVLVYGANQYQAYLTVKPQDEGSKGALKWLWIDKGTKSHRIPKEGNTILAFRSSYSAGSSPGTVRTRPASSGGDMVFAAHIVEHPGTKARGWSEILGKVNQDIINAIMPDVMADVARMSGHAAE